MKSLRVTWLRGNNVVATSRATTPTTRTTFTVDSNSRTNELQQFQLRLWEKYRESEAAQMIIFLDKKENVYRNQPMGESVGKQRPFPGNLIVGITSRGVGLVWRAVWAKSKLKSPTISGCRLRYRSFVWAELGFMDTLRQSTSEVETLSAENPPTGMWGLNHQAYRQGPRRHQLASVCRQVGVSVQTAGDSIKANTGRFLVQPSVHSLHHFP